MCYISKDLTRHLYKHRSVRTRILAFKSYLKVSYLNRISVYVLDKVCSIFIQVPIIIETQNTIACYLQSWCIHVGAAIYILVIYYILNEYLYLLVQVCE